MRKYTTNTNILSSGPALLTNLSIGTKQTSGYIKCILGFLIQTEFGFRFLILFRIGRRVAAFTQKINCLHIISAKKNHLLALKNIITGMGRISLFQYN
jgi:hypothetical protein